MHHARDPPHLDDAPPALLDGGHLWVEEFVDGRPLRFQMRDTGELRFGDGDRTFTPGDEPLALAHAVRHVREHLDRDALRAAVDDPASVTFVGVATTRYRTGYDWDRTPSVVGVDVWSGSADRYLGPDGVQRAFDRLGLTPVPVVEKEVRAAHLDPERFEWPASAFRDGPAAGISFRDKTGHRANHLRDDRGAGPSAPSDPSVDGVVAEHVTSARLDGAVDDLEARGAPVTVDAVRERVTEAVARVEPALFEDGLDERAFRAAVGDAVSASLDGG